VSLSVQRASGFLEKHLLGMGQSGQGAQALYSPRCREYGFSLLAAAAAAAIWVVHGRVVSAEGEGVGP
jgi:hypothetical protein